MRVWQHLAKSLGRPLGGTNPLSPERHQQREPADAHLGTRSSTRQSGPQKLASEETLSQSLLSQCGSPVLSRRLDCPCSRAAGSPLSQVRQPAPDFSPPSDDLSKRPLAALQVSSYARTPCSQGGGPEGYSHETPQERESYLYKIRVFGYRCARNTPRGTAQGAAARAQANLRQNGCASCHAHCHVLRDRMWMIQHVHVQAVLRDRTCSCYYLYPSLYTRNTSR